LSGEESGPRRILWALAGVVGVALVAWFLLHSRPKGTTAPPAPAKFLKLVAPRGELDAPPARFEWQAVEGATRYTVKIEDADAVWPLFVRSTTSPPLFLDPQEASALLPGRVHAWEVQAFDEKGNVVASGGTRFLVRPSASPPPVR
jgi:hypothetical protein